METILKLLPLRIAEKVRNIDKDGRLQEVRLKINKPVILNVNDTEYIIKENIHPIEMKQILQRISNYSVYAYDEQIKQGYITVSGGCRIGISGEYSVDNGIIKSLKNIYSLNIRIAKEKIGCSNRIMKYITREGRVLNTILISPPKCGKTTLIRDIARNISDGFQEVNLKGKKVTIVDERSEIAGSYLGIPQMNVGVRTDVYDGCLKSDGMIMAVRSMSPDVIISDEIGTEEDIRAVEKSFLCGVSVITSIHGESVEDIYRRSVFKRIIENRILDRAIVLDNRKGVGHVRSIYDFRKKEDIFNDY
ncbi:stage III sporulation protein AA [Inconstantimicrobium porci]|uniref:Stage III sporulation protein AA n=1 Tax=Inconstantimicrobium porci TaxID=2652291 RepID=A0A7X2MVW7_9CLOT|nr:stage III sporulation protein AA [Inconstantimicrobium porci]MDD6771892.1 stage III sporulation protein AA [Inconstantimicrobium porci]MSR90034.1 stage III sporulation protein AA [Inconstantimicrobium porci]